MRTRMTKKTDLNYTRAVLLSLDLCKWILIVVIWLIKHRA
jgi:hypothetical protein